ncbi:MAG TPA: phosphoadenylyl-sulfate reductase [Woeseiaceae bacterium]|jgi:phosphoadenosine phosphosulfate reductase|nr:phosphoadenylyl-sulfate reductase [Woeseiaceae bacterium]
MSQTALRTDFTPCGVPERCALDEEESRQATLEHCNRRFDALNAIERVEWSLKNLPEHHILSSSFGAQAAVALHLVTRAKPDIPVVLIDTGYLFPETYRFIDALTERLDLNLQVYRADVSPAWQEARHGKRWEQGPAGIAAYNEEAKVAPMRKALRELEAGTWFAGLRRSQSSGRANTPYLEWAGERWKVHPIADWSDRDVYRYLKRHHLPYHPLWEQGYLSIGDWHTTRSIHEVTREQDLRFFGVQRECGLHEIDLSEV